VTNATAVHLRIDAATASPYFRLVGRQCGANPPRNGITDERLHLCRYSQGTPFHSGRLCLMCVTDRGAQWELTEKSPTAASSLLQVRRLR
jgi:hypothetical protein